jgi:hypothetical protein
LEGQDALFHRVLGNWAIDQDRAALAEPMRPVRSLILDGRFHQGLRRNLGVDVQQPLVHLIRTLA